MAPCFRKTHNLTALSAGAHGHLALGDLTPKANDSIRAQGPLQCGYSGAADDIVAKAWIDSFDSLGYGSIGNVWSGTISGCYTTSDTINPLTKTRSYSASDYYTPVQARKNLHVITGLQVQKLMLEKAASDSTYATATGVIVSIDGQLKEYRARREIVLATGTFNSPKLLELSGIRNPSILQQHEIEVIIDNSNVGENFHDHPFCGLSYEARDIIKTLDSLNRKDASAIQAAMEEYQTARSGPFSQAAIVSHAIIPVLEPTDSKTSLEIERHLSPNTATNLPKPIVDSVRGTISSRGGTMNYFLYATQGNFGSDTTPEAMPGNFITIAGFLCYPLSRGSVHISSKNVTAMPFIDPKFLSHPLDLELMARHIQYIEQIAQSPPMAEKILKPNGLRSPSYAGQIGKQDLEKVKGYVKRTLIPGWHPCGTCAMLPLQDGGVVDARLKVYGTRNVRVVDASIMPLLSRSNPQSTVYAVAERAADLVKEDWKLK